ncbi:H-NS histone family protein [Pseudoduganella ginsengisoli]|uniref:H-NS histone family protein n=2 Tax=Pseudoduganella ginsengisoli TaxID=1462440 RepID=A0A6L6PTV5_9BURK|nr:H-NS histone family protein [Pseudoduganella ginsengisoli]
MDLSNMSTAQLRQLQEQLKKELTQRETQERAQAIEKILAIAKSVGATVEELVAGAKLKAPGAEVAPRYRNPADAGQQWTGRGRQPKWVKDWVEAGNDIEGLRIAA